jgi:ABC-type multidrug transport system fused ATPase/permease subunit
LNFYRTILNSILINLTPSEQKKGIGIIALMIFNGLLDFFSVAAFLPLMSIVINRDISLSNTLFDRLYIIIGFTSHTSFIIAVTFAVLVFVLLKNLVSLWIAEIKAGYAFGIRSNLSSRALMRYMQSSFTEFTKADFARIFNSITNHPLAFTKNIIISITTIISETFVSILILICMIYYDYKVLLLIIVLLFPIYVYFIVRKKNLKKISNELKSIYPLEVKYSNQMIEGFVEINAYQKTNYFYQRFQKISERLTKIFIKDQTLQAGTQRLTEVIVAFVMCSLILYSVVSDLHYQQTLALLAIYAGASFRIVPSINKIFNAMQQIRTNEYLFEEFKIPTSMTSILVAPSLMKIIFTETVELRNISFQYPDGPNALDRISMTIRKGEKIAITGASGEGKTTTLLILLGFLKQTEGELLVDRKLIEDKSAWLNLIGYVPQNPYILDGTVAENIAFGIPHENIDEKKIANLINDLALNDLIHNLPNGIDTRIGERGAKLSGGQRQRIAIARALYADTDILLLDEITNQVHATLELEILDLLNQIAGKKKTIIMVMHKAPKGFFDAIYNLQKGTLQQVI